MWPIPEVFFYKFEDKLWQTNVFNYLDRIHLELPVSLPGDRDVGEVADVVVGVRPAENDFSSNL